MFASFLRYFFNYIFKAKTRQRLLFLALFSLFISSFALIVLQGVMNGLQSSLIARSKNVYGNFFLDISKLNGEDQKKLIEDLDDFEFNFYPEVETELLIRHQSHIAPAIFHGFNPEKKPLFLEGLSSEGIILGADLSRKIQAYYGGEIQLVTPSEMDNLLGDIPRTISEKLSDIVQTDVSEVDVVHGWVRQNAIFNLLKDTLYNKIRFYSEKDAPKVKEIITRVCPHHCQLINWEDEHESLKWALNLENKMMLFLFSAMAFLVAISIMAGLLVFYDKVKRDLASFWILGVRKKTLYNMSTVFTCLLNSLSCLLGISLGLLTLKILEKYSHDLMPEVFVERSLPVEITLNSTLISFFIPMGISLLFSLVSVHYILKENSSFLSIVRGSNQ